MGESHLLEWVTFIFSPILYLVIGLAKWWRIGYQPTVPTLACVLLLVLMTCWLLDAVTFYLDRYRVPVVGALAVGAALVALLPLPGSEHVYRTWTHGRDLSPWPNQVPARGSNTPIVIATTGGDVQAAAWTARVLTGIDEALPPGLRDSYTHSIRLLSTVSGGGVGAMYFAERYSSGGFDHAGLPACRL